MSGPAPSLPRADNRAASPTTPREGPGPDRLVVAQFRDELFKATETFIYEYVRGLRTVTPLLVTFRRVGQEAFPFDGLSVELPQSSALGPRLVRAFHGLVLRRPLLPTFDDPRTYRALEQHGARVLHAHFGRDAWWALPVARRTGLPLVASFYGFDAWMLPGIPGWRERYDQLFQEGRLFLAEGPAMAQRLRDLGCPADRVAVQPIAIDVQRYSFQPRTPDPSGPARLLFCGRFVEKKGLEFALEAVARLRRRHDVVFDIIGDGELRPEIEARIQRLGLEDCTRLRGMVRHDAMIQALAGAHVLLQPSVVAADGDTEGGAPTTLLEAQATGLPIVATRHQDIPHVTTPDSAVLVPERDADALADAIEGLLNEPGRWEAMGRAGRRFVEEHHDRGPLVERLEARYHELAR